MYKHTYLVKGSQQTRLLTGQAISFLYCRYGALQITRNQQLRKLQHSMAQHKELEEKKKTDFLNRYCEPHASNQQIVCHIN